MEKSIILVDEITQNAYISLNPPSSALKSDIKHPDEARKAFNTMKADDDKVIYIFNCYQPIYFIFSHTFPIFFIYLSI